MTWKVGKVPERVAPIVHRAGLNLPTGRYQLVKFKT
jgi:hypothetical protein